ncbi:c-type cytochrome [Acidimangrovimonas pyrenivorans]|uniref:C-type cytochrome n=1 Tax=Acidimangrovimonas pyrenivorans TaxID=2030798 RepID=A0ABV7AKW1_9RHOB
MKKHALTALTVLALASPAFAAGDAAKGEKEFKKCKACHSIIADDGTAIVKGGKVGPNLYGVIGRPAASEEGFRYGKGIQEAAEKGLVWDEAKVAEYVKDPTKFLDEITGDKAKSKMTFKLRRGGEDVAAYLASVVK